MLYSKVIGTGSYLPKKIITNNDLEQMIDTTNEWILGRTGIRERRICPDDMASSDLGARAAEVALKKSGFNRKDIDLLIVTTSSQDMIFPSTASLVQDKLGINKQGPAFDVMAVCAGFIFGLTVADSMIKTGQYKNVLLVGADAMSKVVDWTDRGTCILFGDGAGVMILSATDKKTGILGNYLNSDGSGNELLNIPAGGSRLPCSKETLDAKQHYVKMNGNEIFKFAVRVIPEAIKKVLEMTGYQAKDIDYLIPHQANTRIIDSAVKKIGISQDKVITNLEKYGNTSAASIPIALDELNESCPIQPGQLICMVGFGAGLTWGASLLEWSETLLNKTGEHKI